MAKEKTLKDKADIEAAMAELNKKYGKGTVIKMDDSVIEPIDVISTGSYSLDKATGVGGVPRGRVVELIGPTGSGKTTIAVQTLANAQEFGEIAIIDVEHTFDWKYAVNLGLKKENVYFCQPSTGEESWDIIKALAGTGKFSGIMLDSLAANIPKESHEGETGQARMARLAALNSMEIPKIVPLASENNCTILICNQFRSGNFGGYGSPEVHAGGNALGYYASMIMEIRRTVEKEDEKNVTRVKIVKNKVAPPFGEAQFDIIWGQGVDRIQEIGRAAVEAGLIKRGGAWYTVADQKMQGEDTVIQFLRDNPDFTKTLEDRLDKGEVVEVKPQGIMIGEVTVEI